MRRLQPNSLMLTIAIIRARYILARSLNRIETHSSTLAKSLCWRLHVE